jgi:hypothetical protein
VRFFAHDGQTVHGPSRVDELTKLPNFDGDTLVCPVGSESSADWKPALAYPPFRAVLLAPASRTAPAPRTVAPPTPTTPCPRCAQRNPEKARFCNDCGARMDGREEAPPMASAPPTARPRMGQMLEEFPAPAAAEPPSAPPEPTAPDSFESLSSNLTFMLPSETAPAPAVVDPAPAAAPASAAWRTPLIAAFIGAMIAGSGLGWWLLRPAAKKAAPGSELNLTPPAPSAPAQAMESPQSAPIAAPASVVAAAPAAPPPSASGLPKAQAPAADKAPAVKATRPKAARVRKPRAKRPTAFKPVRAAKEKTAQTEAEKPAPAASAAPPDDGFLLPGVPRRLPVSKKSPKPDAAAKADAPGQEPVAPDRAEDPSASQVREQFEFCSQLLAQGAYADHFDTCLCAGARQSATYGGDRKKYAAAMKKLAEAGALDSRAGAGEIALDGATAKVSAGKTNQNWALEDGLWCRAQ